MTTQPTSAQIQAPRQCCGKHLAESVPCPAGKRHRVLVTFTRRLFVRRWWVICLDCDRVRLGPWPDRGFARIVAANVGGES